MFPAGYEQDDVRREGGGERDKISLKGAQQWEIACRRDVLSCVFVIMFAKYENVLDIKKYPWDIFFSFIYLKQTYFFFAPKITNIYIGRVFTFLYSIYIYIGNL